MEKGTDENTEIENTDQPPKYHYKWMLALLLIAIIGSFVFSHLMKSH